MKKPISTDGRAREKSELVEKAHAAQAFEAEGPARTARRARAWEADVLREAANLAAFGVDVPQFLGCAAYAEWRIQLWLRLNGWPSRDLIYHVHDALEDMLILRAPSVQVALINLWEWERETDSFGEPGALDEVRRVLRRRSPHRRGVKPRSLAAKKRDEDDRDALKYARSCLRAAARGTDLGADMKRELDPHLKEMQRRGRRVTAQALVLWAARTGRPSRDPLGLKSEAEALRDRLRPRKRRAIGLQ
jgi:hypothetical protein